MNITKEIIKQRYRQLCVTPSDIFEHLPTLSSYASQCSTVAEFGMRSVISTWALLHGLSISEQQNKRLVSVNLNYAPGFEDIRKNATSLGINSYFVMGDNINIEIEQTDLLFIDTWHIYGHLKRELAKHCDKVNKYILLHDTTVDAIQGETIRNGWDAVQQSKDTGYPLEEITKGLSFAIKEFLDAHPEWILEREYTNNNGLTVLSRR